VPPRKPLARFRHVIWDWNGTLFDDAWLCHEAMNWLLARYGLPSLTRQRYMEVFTFPVRDYYEHAGFDLERTSFAEVGAEFMGEYERRRGECRLRPEAPGVLRELAEARVGQSVLSAYQHDSLEALLLQLGIRSRFDRVLGRPDVYADSKVAEGRALLLDLGLPPGEVLLVGDTTHDAEVARDVGVACALLPGGNQTPERLAATGAVVLGSLAEVPAFVTGARGGAPGRA
jgi:phosphoglycolate phosphatase